MERREGRGRCEGGEREERESEMILHMSATFCTTHKQWFMNHAVP